MVIRTSAGDLPQVVVAGGDREENPREMLTFSYAAFRAIFSSLIIFALSCYDAITALLRFLPPRYAIFSLFSCFAASMFETQNISIDCRWFQ